MLLCLKRSYPILALLLLASAIDAHDLYLLPDIFQVTARTELTVAFHNGDSFPQSESAPILERLRDSVASGKSGTWPIEQLRVIGNRVLGQVKLPGTGDYLLSVRTVPNLIELPPDKFLSYLKEEGLQEVIDWRTQHSQSARPGRERYSKFAKSLIRSGSSDGYFEHSLEFPIEIIPLKDPFTIHAGNSLPIRVLFRGKPAVGLQVESACASGKQTQTVIVGRTSTDGTVAVPITQAGKWRLHSLKMERCADPKVADWESFWASLTLEIH